MHPLLEASVEEGKSPKFVTITSTVGNVGELEKYPMNSTAYGASKAALNYITRKFHFENQGMVVFPINFGLVSLAFLVLKASLRLCIGSSCHYGVI